MADAHFMSDVAMRPSARADYDSWSICLEAAFLGAALDAVALFS
jgi:hypothetical protein